MGECKLAVVRQFIVSADLQDHSCMMGEWNPRN
jgi:hypothetical protein